MTLIESVMEGSEDGQCEGMATYMEQALMEIMCEISQLPPRAQPLASLFCVGASSVGPNPQGKGLSILIH